MSTVKRSVVFLNFVRRLLGKYLEEYHDRQLSNDFLLAGLHGAAIDIIRHNTFTKCLFLPVFLK
jgi:hypothetical protein